MANDSEADGAAGTAGHVVVVIGAGRSGTSTLTRGIQALGIELGNNLKPGTSKNPKGFFEDEELLALNKRLHHAFGLRGTGASLRLIEEDEWQAVFLNEHMQAVTAAIQKRFGAFPLWGFKSGGVMRLLPFWEQVFEQLGLKVSYVVAARHPLAVARSRAKLNALRGVQEKSDLEWLVRVVPYFHLMRRHPFSVVDYDRLMAEPQIQLRRVAGALNLPLTSDVEREINAFGEQFINPSLQHHRGDANEGAERLNPLARDAYRWLHALACDEIAPENPELWRDWARIRGELYAMRHALRHIDFLEDEVERRQTQGWRRLFAPRSNRISQADSD